MKTQYKTLRINYEARVDLDINTVCEELGINTDDVRCITVNYNILTIKTFDDNTFKYEFDSILIEEDINTTKPRAMMLFKRERDNNEYVHNSNTIRLHRF
jgi:hypothetical protein